MSDIDHSHLKIGFLVLHILGGQIGLPLIIFTSFLAKNVKSPGYLINLWITWVIYSISYCIFIYSGDSTSSASAVCHVQAALIYGAPAMAVIAGLIVVIHTWIALYSAERASKTMTKLGELCATPGVKVCLFAFPYVVFAVFTVSAGVVGSRHPDSIGSEWNHDLYCSLDMPVFGQFLIPIFCAVVLATLIGVNVALAIRYLLRWRQTSTHFPLAERQLSISLPVRIMIFNIYAIIILTATIFLTISNSSLWDIAYVIDAGVPLVACLVFGTSKDILVAWSLWKNTESTEQPPSPQEILKLERTLSSSSVESAISFSAFLSAPTPTFQPSKYRP